MTSSGNILDIMLVDELPERAGIASQILTDLGHTIVATATAGDDLCAMVNCYHPDIIVIDMDSPDRAILEHLHTINTVRPIPIVMFTNNGDSKTIREAVKAGVTAYVVDSMHAGRVNPILNTAMARFEELQSIRRELEKARDSLEQRRMVDQAKGILMKQMGYDEETAYRTLRKSAMDRNMKLIDLARSIITAAGILKKPGQ